jgi:hypothetical protein
MTLGDFLNRLEGVYKSIDTRVAAVKSNDAWHNALTIVRFSYLKPQDLRQQQEELEGRWGKIQTKDFRIQMQAWVFEFLETLCDQFFSEGKLLLLGESKDMELEHKVDLLSLDGKFDRYGYTRRELDSWPCFEAIAGKYCSLLENEQLQGEAKSLYLLELYSLISELLEVDFHRNSGFDLIVNAPFYAMIENVDFAEQKCKIRVKFHKDIKGLAVSAVARRGERDDTPVRDVAGSPIKLKEAEELDEYMRVWTKQLDLLKTMPADYLSVSLRQTEPIALDIQEQPSYPTQISRLLEAKKPAKAPLVTALSRFCSLEELEEYLAKPGEIQPPSPNKPSSAFEGFVSWVLGLCGFQSIWLGWTEHETLKEGKIKHLRLDILAHYEKENTLLLVACTTGRPDQDIDIANSIRQKLYADVFKDTTIQIRGFIFSSQPSVDVAKQLGEKVGVTIFGAEDIRRMLNCLRTGKTADALAYFGFT